MSKTLLLCDCLGSQTVDAAALSEATGLACSGCHTSLCTTQIDMSPPRPSKQVTWLSPAFRRHIGLPKSPKSWRLARRTSSTSAIVQAGPDDTAPSTPKWQRLIADGMLPEPTYRSLDVTSEGTCLIIGAPDIALTAPNADRSVVSDGSADVRRGYSTDT